MKKILSVVLVLALLLSFMGVVPASAEDMEITVIVDGETVNFDVPPQIINDRTMVPVRAIFEALGATVDWDNETRTVTATRGETVVVLTIDTNVIKVNETEKTIDVPAMIVNGRTLVPVRAISEAFECTVEWNQTTYTVTVTSKEEPKVLIDFTNDDGTMSYLQYVTRYGFEQSYLPKNIFANQEFFAQLIKENPSEFLAIVDDNIWGTYRNAVLVNYMLESEEEFVVETEEDLYMILNEMSDKYFLRAYQAYEAEFMMLDETKYCAVFYMNEITDQLKLDELSKMLLASHIAIVYDDATGEFEYYTLERSFGGVTGGPYLLCSISDSETHSVLEVVENNSEAFIEAVTRQVIE